jgi:putative SOS response-associated peptidase YedK
MCGRFTLTAPTELVAAQFEVPEPPLLSARYNIAPSQSIAVVGLKPDGVRRGIALLRWGLTPHWANDDTGPKPINARAESVAFKFTECFRERRCLIPSDGFYEWRSVGGRKRACHFALSDGSLFAFAGLWDAWTPERKPLLSTCIITTTANERVRPVHDRMPVIVPRQHYAEWLDPRTLERRLLALLRPSPAEAMTQREVGPAVNSPRNDGPECLEAA